MAQLEQMKESNLKPSTAVPPPEEIHEDENAVSDTLNQFQIPPQNKLTPNNTPSVSHMPQHMPNPMSQRMTQHQPDEYGEFMEEDYDHPGNIERFEERKDLLTLFRTKSELKRMLIVMISYVIANVLPVQTYLQSYIDLSRIPYAVILIKALIAGLLYMIIFSLFS